MWMTSESVCWMSMAMVLATVLTISNGHNTSAVRRDIYSSRLDFFGDKGDKGGGGGSSGYYGGSGAGYNSGGGYGYGSNSYGMSYDDGKQDKDKDKETFKICGIAIPIVVAIAVPAVILLIPLITVIFQATLGLLLFFARRRSDSGGILNSLIPSMPNMALIETVTEAMNMFKAITTDERCRQRVTCELGYILQSPEKRAGFISIINMLPSTAYSYVAPLKKAIESGSEGGGHCERFACDAARVASQFNISRFLFGEKKNDLVNDSALKSSGSNQKKKIIGSPNRLRNSKPLF